MRGYIMLIKKVTLVFLSIVLLGCSAESKLNLEFDESCFNMSYANKAYLKVTKIGGGYASGEVSVDILNGYTLNLPEKGDYRLKINFRDPLFNSETFGLYYWDETIEIKRPSFTYTATCP